MPPRYAYWTILIDQKPTAFRAQNREDLLPTLHQLQRKNPDTVMKWFARGRLWDTPEQAQWSQRNLPKPREKRGREWRPGGEHTDPRARFKRPKSPKKPWGKRPAPPREGTEREGTSREKAAVTGGATPQRPWRPKTAWKPRTNFRPRQNSVDSRQTPQGERRAAPAARRPPPPWRKTDRPKKNRG